MAGICLLKQEKSPPLWHKVEKEQGENNMVAKNNQRT